MDEVADGTGAVVVPVDDTIAEIVTFIVAVVKSCGSTDPDVRLKIMVPLWMEKGDVLPFVLVTQAFLDGSA